MKSHVLPIREESYWIWLAGFLDGEGHIAVQRTVARKNGRRYYVPIVQVIQAGEAGQSLIHAINRELGPGNTIQEFPKKGNSRAATHLMIYGPRAVQLCQMVLPYLRLKQRQAEVLATWEPRKRGGAGYRKGSHIDPEGEMRQQALFEELRALNRRGNAEP